MDELLENIIINELDDELNLGVIVAEAANIANQGMLHDLAVRGEIPNRNEDFYERTIPHYSNAEFQEHFRMIRETFRVLLNCLEERRMNKVDIVPLQKKLLFTLWILAKQESFLSVGNLFNIATSSGHLFFMEIITEIESLKDQFIKWPVERDRRQTTSILRNKSGIPGIIGAIDGTHIAIKAPVHNPVDYYNRNSYHSIILQSVCNEENLFIDVFVGMPGRIHDSRVFRQSPLFTIVSQENNRLISENEHLLGDKAYPLLGWLVTPYRDNGHLTRQQTTFNNRMSSVRSLIEQTFALLKGKWRRLKFLDMERVHDIPIVVTAACVLHNFIIKHEGAGEELLEDEENGNDLENEAHLFPPHAIQAGDLKRNYIASLL